MADQRSPNFRQDKVNTPSKAKQQTDNARATAARKEQEALRAKQQQTEMKKNMAEEKQKSQQEKLKRDQYLARLEQRRKSRDLNRGR